MPEDGGLDIVSMWLDSPLADEGLSVDARHQLWEVILEEDAYQRFAQVILSPPASDDGERTLKRSWRAMKLLKDDLMAPMGSSVLMNPARAGLLAKDVFVALGRQNINVVHVRTLLEALLEAFPSAVVSAACAGGENGVKSHLGPLLAPRLTAQTLPTITHIVLYGCLGKKSLASAEKTVMHHQQSLQQRVTISRGHRRKFVRTLSEWSFLTRLIECIEHEDENPTIGEDICETILTLVECLGYPEVPAEQMQRNIGQQKSLTTLDKEESVGEDKLLEPLGNHSWWDPLVKKLDGDTSDAVKVAATRIMMGIFTLATGKSSRIRKANAPMTDATENSLAENDTSDIDFEASKNRPHDNKLLDWGLTSKIHLSLLTHLPQLAHALHNNLELSDAGATRHIPSGVSTDNPPGVPHPGRYMIIPFTSWRLHVVTLLAELLSYSGTSDEDQKANQDNGKEAEALRLTAMNAVMDLPLPPLLQSTESDLPANQAFNPWPVLCDLVFYYPENTMYHVQFIRIFRSICLEHHEPSLRLVLQKLKFVSRAIKGCSDSATSCRGVLLVCLNILRLRSQSLPPNLFLRQFLESHDLWKGFKETLIELTMNQERLSFPIPGKEAFFNKQIGIDLGSRYSAQLGFDGIKVYHDEPIVSDSGPKKKRKKKKRKKKVGEPDDADDKDVDDTEDAD